MHDSRRVRSRRRRWPWIGLAGLTALAAWAGMRPVPIGWVINAAARRALPPGCTLQVAAASWHWQFGAGAMRVELQGLTGAGPDGSRVAIPELLATFDKRSAARGHFTPQQVTLQRPVFTAGPPPPPPAAATPAGELPAHPAGPDAPANLRPLLAALDRILPGPQRDCRLVVVAGKVIAPWRGRTLSLPAVSLAGSLRRRDDTLAGEAVLTRSGSTETGRLTLQASASLSAGTVRFAAEGTSIALEDAIAALTGHPLPPLAITFSLTGELDDAPQPLRACSFELLGTGTPAGPAPAAIAPPHVTRLELRGAITRGPQAEGGHLHAELQPGRLLADWGEIELRTLTAELGGGVRARWDARGRASLDTNGTGWLAPVWPEAPAWLAGVVRQAGGLTADSAGELHVQRDADGGILVRALSAVSRLATTVAATPLAATLATRLTAAGQIEAEVRVEPFEPARLAPALPAGFPGAACAFPVRLEGRGRFSATGTWLGAQGRAVAAAGEFQPWGPLRAPVALHRLEVALRMDGPTRIEIPEFVIETGLGRLAGEEVYLQAETDGTSRAGGRFTLADVAGETAAALLPAAALPGLVAWRAEPSDFALPAATVRVAVHGRPAPAAAWELTTARASADLALRIADQPLTAHVDVDLPVAAPEFAVRWQLAEFRPAALGRLGHAVAAAADFDVPLRLSGTARFDARTAALRQATLQGHVGAGTVPSGPAGPRLPLHAADFAAEYDAGRALLRVPQARIALTGKLSLGIERLEVATSAGGRIAGRLTAPDLAWSEVDRWWPADLRPDLRAQVRAHLRHARGELPGIDFEFPAGGASWASWRARGRALLHTASLQIPGLPAAIDIGSAELALDLPRLQLKVARVETAGLHAAGIEVEVTDLTAATPIARVRGTCRLDAGEAAAWFPAGAGPVVADGTGRLQATFAARSELTLGPGWRPAAASCTVEAGEIAGLPLALAGTVRWSGETGRMATAELTEGRLGRTTLTGSWTRTGRAASTVTMQAERIDVAQLVPAFAPWLDRWTGSGAPAETDPGAGDPEARTTLEAAIATLAFGPRHVVRDVRATALFSAHWPERLHLGAIEGAANAVQLQLTPAAEAQQLMFAADDMAALITTVTEPVRQTAALARALPAVAGLAGRIPVLLAGGRVRLDGELRVRDRTFAATGRACLKDATLLRAPRVLQLLALKSGTGLQQTPLIRELAIADWHLTPETVGVDRLTLAGTGLIDRVKLNAARYAFGDGRITADGEYFGIGFTVTGTRADPQIYLKETALIRAIGQRNEFDFFDEAAPRAARE
jgi:hypothetical protein